MSSGNTWRTIVRLVKNQCSLLSSPFAILGRTIHLNKRKMNIHTLVRLVSAVFILGQLPHQIDASCSRLPSGNCWVNCMMDVFDVICSNVTASMVQSDLKIFADTSQMLRVYIWDSPAITRLSNEAFKAVTSQIMLLDFQDLINLNTFPEMKAVSNLTRLNIWNSPKITAIALEQIPLSLQHLSLNKMGVSFLENDFSELKALENVHSLTLRNLTLTGWQGNFFDAFPNLQSLKLANNTFNLDGKLNNKFNLRNMQILHMVSNTFIGNDTQTSDALLDILDSVSFNQDGSLILTDNNVFINNDIARSIQNKTSLQKVILRGNPITADDKILEHWYQLFPRLRYLDLGHTFIKPAEGLLSDLPKLQDVLLDQNNITTMKDHHIFEGSYATNLSTVDLSYNGLMDLPLGGPLLETAGTISRLILRANNLQYFSNETTDPQRTAIMKNFVNLRYLDLSHNNLSRFYGNRLQALPNLTSLDISCNNFTNVTKDFFIGLPKTLTTLHFNFCNPETPPLFEMNAFDELSTIKNLSMRNGKLKRWIFKVIANASNGLTSLEALYLGDNDFTFIRNITIPSMPSLKVLNLNRNRLQSIPANAFANVPELKELYLSGNRISSISTAQFGSSATQLKKLEVLDISRNGIYSIAPGAFDGLLELRSLMIGWNHAPLSNSLFQSGIPKHLTYLGVQNYDHGCLGPEFFSYLTNLKWLFPDEYNFLAMNPDSEKLQIYDPYLVSILPSCEAGSVIPDHGFYPGLEAFISVTIRDSDEPAIANSPQYPIMVAFLPLNYCPMDDYIKSVGGLVCGEPDVMQNFEDGYTGLSVKRVYS